MATGRNAQTVQVKTARRRKLSSTLWLRRQLNDAYVTARKKEGYRSRAAFKLLELQERFHLLKADQIIVDLGAAPGGWLQAAQAITQNRATLLGVDLLPIEPLEGVRTLQGDFTEDSLHKRLEELLEGRKPHVILSDMSPNTTGHSPTDHLRIMGLVECAWHFAVRHLADDGCFVAKVFQGGAEASFLAGLKKSFQTVRHAKPPASRKTSPEQYLIATGFRGFEARL